jgi:hypothetical protein
LRGRLGGQHRVAAAEALAGEVRRGDLGEVLLVEQGQLERAVVGHELADRQASADSFEASGVDRLRPVLCPVVVRSRVSTRAWLISTRPPVVA